MINRRIDTDVRECEVRLTGGKRMRRKSIKYLLIPAIIMLFMSIGCNEDAPLFYDGQGSLSILALGDTAYVDTIPHFIPLKNATVVLASEYGLRIENTNENGILNLTHLPAAVYQITVRQPHPEIPGIMIVGDLKNIEIGANGKTFVDTIRGEQVQSAGISINEIYAGGPVNNVYFFYDQFIELYNYSDSVKYLDGMIIMRVSGNNEAGQLGPGADQDEDGDMDAVTYIFKFPGNPGEHNHPFPPKTFLTCAGTAVNHKNTVATSIDLSTADWEFYNQYSATDFDNPNVKNLINTRSDRTVDFLINLVSDIIVIASGADSTWEDGIDFSTIIDGVKYQSTHTAKKTLDKRIDKSYTLSPAKYGGQSMRRRQPGIDTNDALLDWEIIPAPTPGYH